MVMSIANSYPTNLRNIISMKKIALGTAALLFILSISTFAQENAKERVVAITTDHGVIQVKLYNETPKHRDNFIKLVEDGTYNGTLFHRVIKDFMIQGGDPNSKDASPDATLGNGGPGYTIQAEILDELYHKKGALCAARQGDQVNPTKRSSGSQFYLTQGKVYRESDLRAMEQRRNSQLDQVATRQYLNDEANTADAQKLKTLQSSNDQAGIQAFFTELRPKIDALVTKMDRFSYSDQAVKDYASLGGTPHLDGNYTVFGEVIEGLEIIDKIGALEKGRSDRPVKDIKMTMKVVQ